MFSRKPSLFAVALRLGKDLGDRKVLCGIGEERLIGSPRKKTMQLAGVDFTGDKDVLSRGDAVLLVVLDLVIAVEGKTVFDVAPYPVDRDPFLRLGNLADDGSQRPGRVGGVEQADVFLGRGEGRQAEKGTDTEAHKAHR